MSKLDPALSDLLQFLTAAPTPFHAVAQMRERLVAAGFVELQERDSWSLQAGGRYLLSRNGSSLLAFTYGNRPVLETGLRMLGAHTDSPCLKVKPEPDIRARGYLQIGVEVYGGALLNPWFDRDLSIAGRVTVATDSGLRHVLVDFVQPVALIPSLAIHLDREQNTAKTVNPQQHLPALLALSSSDDRDFRTILLDKLRSAAGGGDTRQVLDFDLCLYDTQPAALVGLHREFIASARLDNLLSCHALTQVLADGDNEVSSLVVCNDHEEVGSQSAVGAHGPMLKSFLERLLPASEPRERVLARSMMISVDNAHGIHPNFADRHDAQHGPLLNAGPVIKLNANQRYASNSETSALFRMLCQQVDAPVQSFVVRSDLPCGSTIGPITAAALGVRTLDIGVPTFAMHSLRELAGSTDVITLQRVLRAFTGLSVLPFTI